MNTPLKTPIRILSILAAVGAATVLSGCAVPAQQRYARQPVNPYEWHTVSVTPVAPGSRVIARETRPTEYTVEEFRPAPAPARVEYTTEPAYPVYTPAPVYAPPPAYYYPPVTIGLDFVFGNWGHRHHRHHRGRRH